MSGSGSDMRARETEYLWYDRCPVGRMAAICGAPNMGKSTLGYRIAADCDVPTLFVSEEEDAEEVWLPRLLAVGADPAKCFYHPEVMFSKDPAHIAHLASLIEKHKIKLIVVDPIQAHIETSISHDQAVRRIMRPYMNLFRQRKVALVLECHLLTALKSTSHPQLAVPSGLRTWTKAGFILAKDPKNDDFRILATAKWNQASEDPASLRFEFASNDVNVIRAKGGGLKNVEYGYLLHRGESKVGATTLLVSLTKETTERKGERAAKELIKFLKDGKDGRSQPVEEIQKMVFHLDPPMSFKTVKRVSLDLGIEVEPDPNNKSKKWWRLPDWIADMAEELTEPGDDVDITEVDAPDDTFPEEWADDD